MSRLTVVRTRPDLEPAVAPFVPDRGGSALPSCRIVASTATTGSSRKPSRSSIVRSVRTAERYPSLGAAEPRDLDLDREPEEAAEAAWWPSPARARPRRWHRHRCGSRRGSASPRACVASDRTRARAGGRPRSGTCGRSMPRVRGRRPRPRGTVTPCSPRRARRKSGGGGRRLRQVVARSRSDDADTNEGPSTSSLATSLPSRSIACRRSVIVRPRPPAHVLHGRGAVAPEVAADQLDERVVPIECARLRGRPFVEERVRMLLAIPPAAADQPDELAMHQEVGHPLAAAIELPIELGGELVPGEAVPTFEDRGDHLLGTREGASVESELPVPAPRSPVARAGR